MNATLYDPADVAFKPGDAGPRPMCAGCGQIEVGAHRATLYFPGLKSGDSQEF